VTGRRGVIVVLAVAGTFGVVVGACSGDDGGGTGAAVTTEEAVVPGAQELEQVTEEDGAGEHPVLEWSPVSEAAEYRVVVSAADGTPYWAWTGTDAEVELGAGAGPVLTEAMTWYVLAFDAEGELLGASRQRAIAP
jgi:hypothetical protein